METAMIQTTEFETTQTIDPREAKLKDIIERGKTSLQKTLEEIQHEFAIREDMAVKPTAIDFLVQDHKIRPVIRDEAYNLTDSLIVRTTSEDLLTANVFGILKNLDPKIWLRRFLGEAIKGKDFSRHTFENLSFEFWKRYRPPVNRKYREGISEVDVTISFKDGIIFIEAKYLAPVSLKTSNDPRRDQVIRYLDLAAYHFLNHPDTVKEFYFVLIIDTDKLPWILTRYRYNQNLIKGLTRPGLLKPPVDTSKVLSKGIGWLTWKQLRKILELTKDQFRTQAERRSVDDLIVYLDYKIREAERIRHERKQLSFW